MCGTRQAMSRGPPQRRRARARNGVAPYIPAAFCRDARSAGYGATEAARPFRSLQARGFASGMEARQGGDSFAGSVHDSPPRQGNARESYKQEKKGRNRKKNNSNSNKHSNHRSITSGRVTGDAPAWPASLPAGASMPGGGARTDRRPPPPALVSPVSAALKDVVTAEENRLLIRHKITDFINNLRGGERFLPHLTTPRINHGFVITQNFACFRADVHFSSPPLQGRHCRPVR
ncbi:hypothetical protein CSC39_4828 (plasmid) [Escherichia coli]|nr:hypothetical protein CSC39_4828 [Escherichia coli]